MKKIMVSFGRAVGVQGSALLPAVLEDGQVNVFVVLKYAEFEIFFHVPLLVSRPGAGRPRIGSGFRKKKRVLYTKMIAHYKKLVQILHFDI